MPANRRTGRQGAQSSASGSGARGGPSTTPIQPPQTRSRSNRRTTTGGFQPIQPAHSTNMDSDSDPAPPGHFFTRPKRKIRQRPSTSEFGVVTFPASSQTHTSTSDSKGKEKESDVGEDYALGGPTARLVPKKAGQRSSPYKRSLDHQEEVGSSSDEKRANLDELERLRKEIVELKAKLADVKLLPPLQPEEAESQLVETRKAMAEQASEITLLKKTRAEYETFREVVEHAVQCQICLELMHKPYALNPCGHVCCVDCLQSWFRSADEANPVIDDRPSEKTCPYCRAPIRVRPVQLFIVKALVDALEKDAEVDQNLDEGEAVEGEAEESHGEDPWEGMFSGEEVEGHSEEESSSTESELGEADLPVECPHCQSRRGYDENDACLDCNELYHEDPSDDNASHSSQNSSLFHSGEDPAYGSDDGYHSDSDLEHIWIYPTWSPRSIPLLRRLNPHLSAEEFTLCRRGVPIEMIRRYDVTYSHAYGLSARVRGGTVWLGWNLYGMEDDDWDGSQYMEHILDEMRDHPQRYELVGERSRARIRGAGWEAWKLIRQGGNDDISYVDTDSSAD